MLPIVALIAISGFGQPSTPLFVYQQLMADKKYADWTSIEDLTEAVRKDYRIPGLCIGYQQLGKHAETAVSGVRSTQNPGSNIQIDDRLLVGTIGESMTATMIARLIEQEKFGWKTTLEFALPGIQMRDEYKNISILDLLSHRSGLPPNQRITQADFEKMTDKAQSATEARKAYVSFMLMQDPVPVLGGQQNIGNADYVVAGYIAERLIHQSYEWLMQRNVFSPMKMSTATIEPVGSDGQVGDANSPVPHVQSDFGYSPYLMPMTKLDWIMAPTGSGVSCSVGDLLRFAAYHLRGIKGDAQVLKAESYRFLHTVPAGAGIPGFAFGWKINSPQGGEKWESQMSTDGTFYADLTLWPDRDLAVVAVTNAGVTRKPSPTMEATLAIRNKFDKKN